MNNNQPWLRASIKITKPIVLIDLDGVFVILTREQKN